MFLTAAEEWFLGHVTIEEIKPWVKVIEDASVLFRGNGIGVSLRH